jgi:hypothetical protein
MKGVVSDICSGIFKLLQLPDLDIYGTKNGYLEKTILGISKISANFMGS